MSMQDVQAIILRAVTDRDYRELFFRNRTQALEGYDLAKIETAWLHRLERNEFELFAPEVRSSLAQGGDANPAAQRI